MKENIINFIKPTVGKIALSLSFLAWQYFYSYQNIRMEFLYGYSEYLTSALSAFNWGNYFVRNFSLFLIWIIVAVIIFLGIWFSETILNLFHNLKIKKKYANQKESNYEHLLKENIKLAEHLRSRSLWISGIMIFLISLFALSDLFERLRFSLLDGILWKAFEAGTEIDFYNNNYIAFSFVVFVFFWYLLAALIIWIFAEQKEEVKEEKIAKEHYAVRVDPSNETK